MATANTKVRVQHFGRFLSSMVMPNIGAFVAWGLITTLFIPTGWIPNEHLSKLVGPMIINLLPLLIGYTGGKMIGGERGGVVGAVATMGVIVSASIPMFMGAMVAGPVGGWAIKKFDDAMQGKIKSGFEMLVNNFSAGIIGMIVALVMYLVVGPIVSQFTTLLGSGVDMLVKSGVLPLTSILVEPAKILFLNNAINHGVFTPLGTQAVAEHGKAIFFLIEANPGPGLGLLLAYWFFGRGDAKGSAPAAAIIHFLGGIHEIYFPYVLMKPRLILAMIAGGMTGVFMLTLFGAGLRAPASPGSIFAVLLMTPADSIVGVLASVICACAVSFVIAAFLLKTDKSEVADENLDAAAQRMRDMKAESKGQVAAAPAVKAAAPVAAAAPAPTFAPANVRTIVVACDAGMGSSAMGASLLRKKLDQAGLKHIASSNTAINSLPANVDLVITHRDLTERARRTKPDAVHMSIDNFLDGGFYDRIVGQLKSASEPAAPAQESAAAESGFQLRSSDILLGLKADTKEEAIRRAGEHLVSLGYVKPGYVDAMLKRETIVSTYLGQGLAIPHGTNEAKGEVLKTGVVVCQYPQGVSFGSDPADRAFLVVGIAAKNNEHMAVMSALARALDDETLIGRLATTSSSDEILKAINPN
jgi:mannitol PTS system EIICBA or EIICB component